MSAAVKLGSRFVECNVTVFADTEKLEVNTARRINCFVVFLTHLFGILCNTVGYSCVVNINVNLFKKILVHEIAVALLVVGSKTEIFVKIKGLYL